VNTPSHLLINAALRRQSGRTDIPRSAFLLGSVAPDLALALLTVLFLVQQRGAPARSGAYDDLFFYHPLWIAAHNLLHSPLALGVYLTLFWRYRRRPGTWGHWGWWFAVSCGLHTLVDLATHVTDGPLLFWPLNWSLRFHSPISYWDPAHFGRQFFVVEIVLDVFLLAYLLGPRLLRRWSRMR